MPDGCHSHRKVSGLGLWIISFTVGPVLKLYNRSIASYLEERERGELWCGERGGTGERTWRKGWQWLGEKGSSPSSPRMRHTCPSQLTWSCMCVHVHIKRGEINSRLIITLSTKKSTLYLPYSLDQTPLSNSRCTSRSDERNSRRSQIVAAPRLLFEKHIST